MSPYRTPQRLPLWTWIAPLFVFATGSWISILFKTYFGSSIFYLPLALGIVLLHWWGPRVLTALYINTLIFSAQPLTEITTWLIATHTTACGLASWVLFRKMTRGDCRLETINDLLKFTLLGLMIPIALNSLYYPFLFQVTDQSIQKFWDHVSFLWVADFSTCFAIAVPALYFLTPVMDRLNLTLRYSLNPHMTSHKTLERLLTNDVIIVLSLLVILSFSVEFKTYWFLYGTCMLYLSVRHGFEVALIGNLSIFLLVYVMPYLLKYPLDYTSMAENSLANIHLGMSLVYVSSAVVGRVISDLKYSELVMLNKNKMLEITNDELNKVNTELDRFVYSVSHDLSAPLKTIKGLVNISRIENSPDKLKSYVDMIDGRVDKLENFIGEVIDFSKSSRREIKFENISIRKMMDEILEIHTDPHLHDKLEIIKDFQVDTVVSDRMLLRIILNNIISNAIKYSSHNGQNHFVAIRSEETNDGINIRVTDNGEGIPEDIQHKVFNMFFRGTMNSDGSGLGLYIAKEAATRIQGKISVNSKIGKGSEFIVHLPLRAI
jgi:two-component system, sensor histidine kinase